MSAASTGNKELAWILMILKLALPKKYYYALDEI